MKQIIITAILAAICTVGGATSFVMNDLPSYTAWKQDNAQQFKKTPKYDGIDQQKDKYYNNDKDYKKVNGMKDDKDHKDHKDYKNQKDKKDKKDKKDYKDHRDYDYEMNHMPMPNTTTQSQGQMATTGSAAVSEQPAQQGTQPTNGATQAPNIQSSADQIGQ
jgi:hypothetical protein